MCASYAPHRARATPGVGSRPVAAPRRLASRPFCPCSPARHCLSAEVVTRLSCSVRQTAEAFCVRFPPPAPAPSVPVGGATGVAQPRRRALNSPVGDDCGDGFDERCL